MIQDRWVEFTRRYFCVTMRPDLNPLSKPEDSPREKDYENLLEYCRARRKGFQGLRGNKQPLIEVSRAPIVVNNLNPSSVPMGDPKRHYAKYLIPELCVKCTIPASIFRTATLLPSILRRLDDVLLVKELNAKFFDHAISEHYLHAAVSAPSAAVEFDYERLELLGDAYLKYLSSIYLFVTLPTYSEGALHILRQRIISNRALLRNSNRCGLPQYIQSKSFTPKIWSPPNFLVYRPPKTSYDDNQEGNDEDPSKAFEEGELGVDDEGLEDTDTQGVIPNALAPEPVPVVADAAAIRATPLVPTDSGGPSEEGSVDKKKQNSAAARKMTKRTRQVHDSHIQWLGDKVSRTEPATSGYSSCSFQSVADVAEAIIGAAYVTRGREIALKVTKALNVPVPHIDRWSDFGRKALAPPPEFTAKLVKL